MAKGAFSYPYFVVDRIGYPGDDEGSPADAKDSADVASGEQLAASVNNQHVHLTSILGHVGKRDNSQPGDDMYWNMPKSLVNMRSLFMNVIVCRTISPRTDS